MDQAPLVKIQAATATEVCAKFDLDVEAKPLLRDGMKPHEFLAALAEKNKYVEAIDFMAHALPAPEGVWWGCLCLQHALGDSFSPADKAAAAATVRWVMQPAAETRAAAKTAAEPAGPLSPAGSLALAASQSAGASQPFAAAKSVARAVKLASLKAGAGSIARTQRSYVELGIEIARGKFS